MLAPINRHWRNGPPGLQGRVHMSPHRSALRSWGVAVAAAMCLSGMPIGSGVAAAAPAPVQQRPAGVVTADALPTAQINGVAWGQQIVGNTVYVGGSFTAARPPGSAPGTNEMARGNLMAYDVTTGALSTSFSPMANAQVKAVTAAPDGSRVYVGGSFTSIDGVARYRLAALDPATGAVVASWAPQLDYTVNSIVATDSTVYVGGQFSSANGQPRASLAAFSAQTGELLAWAPSTDNTVYSMVLTPDRGKLVVGGNFTQANSSPQYGMAAFDPVSAAALPWAANTVVRNATSSSAILSLSTDGTSIYGGGYTFSRTTGNLEGMFRADPATGNVEWIEDCHGDTYGVYAASDAVYQVGHAHYCGNDMGWPQPSTWKYSRAIAFSKNATGTLIREPLGYANWAGWASPSLLQWFPSLEVGTYTGQSQAAWTVTGNSQYVVLGGEFPKVNGSAQQGLARFAVSSTAPNKQGPRMGTNGFLPTLTTESATSVRVSFPANWDRDDRTLTYKVFRDGNMSTPAWTGSSDSSEFDRPALGFVDTGLAPGSTHTYQLMAADSHGNKAFGSVTSVTLADRQATTYEQTVAALSGALHWPLDGPSGSSSPDRGGYNNALLDAGATLDAGGVSDGAVKLSGAAGGSFASQGTLTAPNTFTLSSWFKTTSTRGGTLVGFADLQRQSSGHRDRQIYLSNTGKISFGVNSLSLGAVAVTSSASYNDGQWHLATASLGPTGMALSVDGIRVGGRADVTEGEKYLGYWRVGGDKSGGFANSGTSGYLNAVVDEIAVFPSVLTRAQINQLVSAGGGTPVTGPADPYGSAVFVDGPTLYWRLGDRSGTTATDSGAAGRPGTYRGGYTLGASGAVTGTSDTGASFNGSTGYVSSNSSLTAPAAYSLEAWVKTTSTVGGKVVGFGNQQAKLSTKWDRHIYLQNDGKVAFSGNGTTTLVSDAAVNDGTWHHIVATQGPNAIDLYVDGQLRGHLASTVSVPYPGYWKVAGDKLTTASSNYLSGSIDEVAVYDTVLDAVRVTSHFRSGGGQLPNVTPVAKVTAAVNKLTVAVDAGASSDADGTITTYAWDFGDGTTGTGVTASHAYTSAGTYAVRLTVTDDRGGTATTTQSVTTVANQGPTARFTVTHTGLAVALDAAGSSDPDGTITSYEWDFGDGTTTSGDAPRHTYTTAGRYTVTLTVTDSDGATASSSDLITVAPAANQSPTASFSSVLTGLSVSLDGTGSTDPDGSIASYSWDLGDGTTATGETTTHTYATPGSYSVTLTVTDDQGSTDTRTSSVIVAPLVLAKDDFARTSTTGWGTAETGGAWNLTGSPAGTVTNGTASLSVAKGATRHASLPTLTRADADVRVTIGLDQAPEGGSTMVSAAARRTSSGEYRATLVHSSTGKLNVQLVKVMGGTATTLKVVTVPNYVVTPGSAAQLRFMVSGTSSVDLKAKVWAEGSTEPTDWLLTATDAAPEPPLQTAGALSLVAYVSASATNAPVVVSFRTVSAVEPR